MKKTRVIGIIPARYASKRFPGKLLADLNGKPVIQHTWEQANKVKTLDILIIATDSPKIANIARQFGAIVDMTPECKNGTERVARVSDRRFMDIIVNIQGDEPFICPFVINELVNELLLHADEQVASIGCSRMTLKDLHDPNVVKLDINWEGHAIGFSRTAKYIQYKHIGIYAYRREFLEKFVKMPKSENEIKEKLEQLRILDNGYKIRMVTTKYNTIAIDTPEDLDKARRVLDERYT